MGKPIFASMKACPCVEVSHAIARCSYATHQFQPLGGFDNLNLGIWLFVSPWALNFATVGTAAWNAWIFGVALAAVAEVGGMAQSRDGCLACCRTPWVLGFSGVASAKWNAGLLSGNELFRGAGFSLPSYTQR
jgi:hypothetical protein